MISISIIKAGRSDTADGGNVLLESGSSSSSNTGTISIASKLSESGGESGIVSLKSGDSTSSIQDLFVSVQVVNQNRISGENLPVVTVVMLLSEEVVLQVMYQI